MRSGQRVIGSSGHRKPLCIDLYCGLGGWAEGFLTHGYRVIGFDIEKHDYGHGCYPGELVIADVLSLDGSDFKDARCIVASPPCQEPSYRAMPWTRAKILNAQGPPSRFISLFEACFRIQREASHAAGRHIPLIVENVKGAQTWVGTAANHYGSYYLWGNVPKELPKAEKRVKVCVGHINRRNGHPHTKHLTNPCEHGVKQHGSGRAWFDNGLCRMPSASLRRKEASALIAKIPLPLATYVARSFLSAVEVSA